MAYIDVVDPEGELVHAGMGLRFPKKTAGDILLKLGKFGVGLLVREDGSIVDDNEDVDSPCVYRLVRPTIYSNPSSTSIATMELPGPVKEVLRSIEKALKRHTHLMETLIRTGVKINSTLSSPPARDSGGKGGPQCHCSPESSSSAAQDDMAGTSSGTCKL